MKIDKISAQPDRAGRYAVVFSDESTLRLYKQTVQDFGLYTGMEMSMPEYEALTKAANQMSAKMRAVRIVSASNVSKRDLEQRLVMKGEDPGCAKEAVRWMSELELLDDSKTAQQIVSSCIAKGYGEARAKQALYENASRKNTGRKRLRIIPTRPKRLKNICKITCRSRQMQRLSKR